MMSKRTSKEFFILDRDGNVTDAGLPVAILDNADADATIGQWAVKRAIARGMSRDDAERLYSTKQVGKTLTDT